MYPGAPEDEVKCPNCGTKLLEIRPPFRFGSSQFSCEGCSALLRFSKQSQNRMALVVLSVVVFCSLAIFLSQTVSMVAGLLVAVIGTILSLSMLVWQGKAEQLEVVK